MVETLKGLGYQAVSEPVSGLYRVRIYGFQSRDEAEKVVSKLKSQGIESFWESREKLYDFARNKRDITS